MAKKKQDYDWLDDAFDDKKTDDEIRKAKQFSNLGCIFSIVAIVIFILVIILIFASWDGPIG